MLRAFKRSSCQERYSFWEGEDGVIRGLPSDEQSSYFSKCLEINLEGALVQILRLNRFVKPRGHFQGLKRPERTVKKEVQEPFWPTSARFSTMKWA